MFKTLYVTLKYLEPCHIWNLRNIRDPVKRLWAVFFKVLCNPDIFRILVFSEPDKYSEPCQASMIQRFFNEPWHIYDEVFYSKLYANITFIDSWCILNLSIFNSRHSRYCESLKYSIHRTLCNLDIFTTYVYSSPSTLRTRRKWWAVFYRTLCDTGIFRTRGIFQTLSNIYYGEFYSESCVTLAYLKPWHIQNQRHIHNTVKHLSWNI